MSRVRDGRRAVVIGGGIAGLSAAWSLSKAGWQVVVFEADDRWGGKITSSSFGGLTGIDAGADAFLARVPEARALAVELGIGDDLIAPATGAALVVRRGRLHPIPDGLVLGVPAGLGGLARSRLISWPGKLRAAADVVLPRRDHGDSLGRLISGRFGREIADYLVDPLVGSINAGTIDELSLEASTPQIAPIAQRSRSLLLGLRQGTKSAPGGPVFLTPHGGMASLVDRLVGALVAAGVTMHSGCPITSLRPAASDRWLVDDEMVDGVVLATPAGPSAALIRPHASEVADQLADIAYAGVVMVTALVPRSELAAIGAVSGYLVPKPEQGQVTAVSFSSRKWPHWWATDHEVMRVSLGHTGNPRPMTMSDDEIRATVSREVGGHLGLQRDMKVAEFRITRWENAFPQYRPGHPGRVLELDRQLELTMPGIVLAGAAYRGIGIPACIRDGVRAAHLLSERAGNAPE